MFSKRFAYSARSIVSVSLIAAGLCAPVAALAQEKLVVWFTKGFYPAEDKALETMVYRFEQKFNVKVELSLNAV